MRFVAFFQSAQDRDGALHAGLTNKHRLETTLQCGVFLDVLLVFIERGGTNHTQFAACEHGLEHIARIHAAFGLARADQRVHFVNEHDVQSVGRDNFRQHRLETFFELPAKFRTGDERSKIERHEALVLETFGHVAIDHALRESLGDSSLADTWFANQHGIVFGAAR